MFLCFILFELLNIKHNKPKVAHQSHKNLNLGSKILTILCDTTLHRFTPFVILHMPENTFANRQKSANKTVGPAIVAKVEPDSGAKGPDIWTREWRKSPQQLDQVLALQSLQHRYIHRYIYTCMYACVHTYIHTCRPTPSIVGHTEARDNKNNMRAGRIIWWSMTQTHLEVGHNLPWRHSCKALSRKMSLLYLQLRSFTYGSSFLLAVGEP